jgi:hypothetical protein
MTSPIANAPRTKRGGFFEHALVAAGRRRRCVVALFGNRLEPACTRLWRVAFDSR